MELLVSVDDFCVQKILVAAAFANLNIKLIKGKTEDDLVKLHPLAQSIVLNTNEGFISQHTAILRYIASSCKMSELYGSSEFEAGQVFDSNIMLYFGLNINLCIFLG